MALLDAQLWAEVERVFTLILEMPADERAAFLGRECHDEVVRREVASLLEHAAGGLASADAAIAATASAIESEADPDLRWIGAHFGAYKVESVVGHGGMAAVYRASRDDAEFHQQVAIKLLRAGAQSPNTLQRFKQERQILAHLQHPNIARLLDGGTTPDGVPYLVMEFVEGEAITAWCERHALKLEQRLRLFLQVCDAAGYAHRGQVVHRDLKPANILVTEDGTPKLLDFGIAKMLVPDTSAPDATATGTQVMTPEYASPEQVRGDPISPAVDVYALGLILYELLTGEKAQKMPNSSPSTVALVVCQTEPAAPAAVKPQLAGDLDNIIRAAIRKEPQRRYHSVAELARDVQLHLEGRPVTARPDTLAYRTTKFLRRNRTAVRTNLVVGGTLCGALGLAFWLSAPGRLPRVRQVTQITQAGNVSLNNGLATDGSRVYMVVRAGGIFSLAQVSVRGGTPQIMPDSPPNVEILDISPDRSRLLVDGPGAEDGPLLEVPTAGGAARRIGDAVGHSGAWSRDGRSIVFVRGSAIYRINRDGSGLRKLLELPASPDSIRIAPAPQPAVMRFAMMRPNSFARELWEASAEGSNLHLLLPNWNRATDLAPSDDSGNWIAGGKYYMFRSVRSGITRVWTIKEGSGWLSHFRRNPVEIHSTPLVFFWLAPVPDGGRAFFLAGQDRRQLVRFDRTHEQFEPFLPGVPGRWISFSKDGRWLAYTTLPQDALWRSRPDGSGAVQLTPPGMGLYEPSWSPDGAWILAYGGPPLKPLGVYAIPAAGGAPESIARAYVSASWSPDGQTVLLAEDVSRGLYLEDWKTRKMTFVPGSESLWRARWSPDGRYIAATDGVRLRLYEVKTGRWMPLATGNGLGPPFWSKDGKYVYYQEAFEGVDQPISRVRISSGKIERVAGARQIPQSDLAGYALAGLSPDDAPIAVVLRTNSDVYSLDLELP